MAQLKSSKQSDFENKAKGSKIEKEKMAEKTYVMTQAEKEQLEAELEGIQTRPSSEVVERIKIARSYGDLSENSEYEAAKDRQAFC